MLYNPNFNSTEFDGFKYANILQLVILSNLENLNAEMIEEGLNQHKRIEKLNGIAKKQYAILQESNSIKRLEELEDKNIKKIIKFCTKML